jgi:D-arabinose 5-phosphate isomerase GutQ
MFAMRLMHLGYHVYVAGETTTPSLRRDDLLIACSGSGTTSGVLTMIATAHMTGARIVAVTTAPKSPLGQVANVVITIPAAAKQDHSQQYSEQFAGSRIGSRWPSPALALARRTAQSRRRPCPGGVGPLHDVQPVAGRQAPQGEIAYSTNRTWRSQAGSFVTSTT